MQDTTTTQETATAPVQEFKWYVLRVINGKEKKVKEYLDKEMELSRKDGKEKWANNIKRLFLPVEKVYKVQKGKKVIREKNYYPGYVMIEVDGKLTDDAISNIKNTTNVIHFLGKENPVALRKSEVDKMLGNVDQMSEGDSIMHAEHFIRGDSIKIIDGPFKDFNGAIEEVNEEKKRLKVNVKIFGRNTPVELTFMQVEKLS
jgi:transcriptional antiterminator NusG